MPNRSARAAQVATDAVGTDTAPVAIGDTASLASARSQRLVTRASTQAVVAGRALARTTRRFRGLCGACGLAGVIALACSLVTSRPGLVPVEWLDALRFVGCGLGLLPVVLLLLLAFRDEDEPRTALSATAARTQAAADHSRRLAAALREAERIGDLSTAHLRTLEDLIEAAEADAERISREERKRRGSRRHRRHERIVPRHVRVTVRTADGRQLAGRIADVSLSGVALAECLPRVAVGDQVLLGRHPAVATRLWETGIAFAFKTELDPSTFDEGIVL